MDDKTIVETKARIRAGPGTRLNDLYQIDSLIAVGGMGEVYRGHVIETGDPVAIKTIRPDFAENANALALFRKEAAALHTIHHGAVVRYYVFSIDRRLDLPYLAMEYVTGESLADALKRGPLDFASVEILRRRLASGLQAAHEAGIIHRDVSPDNVILPEGDVGRAKIIDFGIARTPLAGQTVIGDGFAGKYAYVSPEQFGLQGGVVTPKSDIYSLGLVLAEASRGRPLDMGSSPADRVARRSAPPDLAGVDSRLVPILEAMLRPDPRLRPASMADVALWGAPIQSTRILAPAPKGGPRRGLVLGGAGAGLAAAAGIAFAVLRPSADRPAVPDTGTALAERAPIVSPPIASRPSASPPSASPPSASQPPERQTPASAEPPPAVDPVPQAVRAEAPERKRSMGPPREPAADRTPQAPGGDGAASRLPASETPQQRIAAREEPAAPAPPPVPDSPTMEQVAGYIRGYQGGPCFFLNPTTVSPREAAVEAYGASSQPFVAFDSAFKGALGFEAKIQLRQVDRAQCPVVDLMAQQAQTRPASVPKLKVDHDRIRSGEELSGSIDLGDEKNLKLLLVDGSGIVHDLAGNVTRNGRQASFTVRLEVPSPERSRSQLLVAVASREPLAAIGPGGRSEAVFQAIGQEADRQGSGVGLAVRYVKVGG